MVDEVKDKNLPPIPSPRRFARPGSLAYQVHKIQQRRRQRSGDSFAQVVSLTQDLGGLLLTNTASSFFQEAAGITPATAADDPVGLWVDSANGNDASQAVALARPLLKVDVEGRTYLQFDGVDDTLQSLAATTLAQPNTICVAFKVGANAVTRPIIAGTLPNRHNMTADGTNRPLIFAGGSLIDTSGTAIVTGSTFVMTGVFNGASSKIRINQVETATGAAGAESFSGMYIGSNGTAFSNVQVYGVSTVNAELSESQLSLIEGYMASVIGL